MMLKANAWQQAHPVMKENDRNWERGTWHTGVMAAALAECQGDDGYHRIIAASQDTSYRSVAVCEGVCQGIASKYPLGQLELGG
jgi:hypothetical protein